MAHLLTSTDNGARPKRTGRRDFFKVVGGGSAAAALVIAGCDTGDPDPPVMEETIVLDFSTDVGVLNYAYLLEQLEARFYALGVENSSDVLEGEELGYFEDIADHEAIHRDFFAAALAGNAQPTAEFDFSGAVDFGNRQAVLGFAQILEDTGVAAYNGAGRLLESGAFLTLAGKIVSVEARHAATIRDIIGNETSFADLEDIGRGAVPENGLDAALPPGDILAAVTSLNVLRTEVEVRGL